MRLSFFMAGLLAKVISANIIFNHVPLSCDRMSQAYTGCLRGQHCTENGTCEVASGDLYPSSFRPTTGELSKRDYSVNGQCGPNNGNLLCDPNATGYTGTCCSQYGWCGNTPAHCGDGCVSGCSSSSPSSSAAPTQPSSSTTPRSDGRCGHDFGGATCDPKGAYGGCCSQYGYCGSTDGHCSPANGCQNGCAGASQPSSGGSSIAQSQPPSSTTTGEPVISSPSSTSQATNGGVTTDGSCGQANGGTTCGNWPQGSCCSMYGYCGNTASHCGAGCQSGPCAGGAAAQAPGPSPAPANPNGGSFQIVGQSGAPAMHAGLLPNGRFFVLDKVENYTQIKLSNGQYAYSTEYDPATNTYVPLSYVNNAFCAGGSYLADGRVVSLGGNAPLPDIDPTVGNGFDAIRYLSRSSSDASLDGQGWSEPGNKLASKRWYPSAQTLPDGTVFVASGSLNGLDPTIFANNNPTWELLDSQGVSNGVSVPMDILAKNQPYYMYPFIHLMSDGNLFVFTSKSSESFNVGSKTTIKAFPDLPGDYRTYPNTGGSVMLPLSSSSQWAPDIVVCGGGAYQDITSPTDPSCGRIQPLGAGTWEMDSMPEGRGMVEGTILPDGTVIWLNGCDRGAQGYGLGASPTYEALIYDPTLPLGKRWTTGASSTIARMYHSVAFLLLDGTLLVTGSNPVEQPILQPSAQNPYVTEFRVEVYTPPYLSGDNAKKRPTNVQLSSTALKANGAQFTISFTCPQGAQGVKISLYHGGFVTHSVHMGHRMAFLDNTGFNAGSTSQTVTATMPPSSNIAPPGPYVVYVVVDGVPSVGQTVLVS